MSNGNGSSSLISSTITIPKPRAPQAMQSPLLQDVSVYKAFNALTQDLSTTDTNKIPGFVIFSNGILVQWLFGTSETSAAESQNTYTWPQKFKSILCIQVTTIRPNGNLDSITDIFSYQVVSWTDTNVVIYRARRGNDDVVTTQPWILGVGF
jgi:hypothetical protein